MAGKIPVDVSLLGQLALGAGSALAHQIADRQRNHDGFLDALREPSVKLAGVDYSRGERSSLYSFFVGSTGHPIHRHAGPRVFTAISGSSGAQLRFSSMPLHQALADTDSFINSFQLVNIPPDSLFTVRFPGGTWHQFMPGDPQSKQPAFIALSCHVDEFAGLDTPELLKEAANNLMNISKLTQILPESLQSQVAGGLAERKFQREVWLSLSVPALTFRARACRCLRTTVARLRTQLSPRHGARGFATWASFAFDVEEEVAVPEDSLLHGVLQGDRIDHQDTFRCRIRDDTFSRMSAIQLLDCLLRAFVERPPTGVTALVVLRNALVSPFRLRRSRLGCPVSSLAGALGDGEVFAERYPVLTQEIREPGSLAQVLLGADDRHLRFRTCVSVKKVENDTVEFSLGNRVVCRNRFGRFYMASIHGIHRRYVAPAMLRAAVKEVLFDIQQKSFSEVMTARV